MLAAVASLIGQGVYILCLRYVGGSLTFLLLIELGAADMLAGMLVLAGGNSGVYTADDDPTGYVLLVIPGFIFLYFIQKRFNRPPQAGSPLTGPGHSPR